MIHSRNSRQSPLPPFARPAWVAQTSIFVPSLVAPRARICRETRTSHRLLKFDQDQAKQLKRSESPHG